MIRKATITALVVLVLIPGVTGAEEDAASTLKGKPALIVMDIQNAYVPMMDDEGKEQALYFVNYAISKFRERGLPVIVVLESERTEVKPTFVAGVLSR